MRKFNKTVELCIDKFIDEKGIKFFELCRKNDVPVEELATFEDGEVVTCSDIFLEALESVYIEFNYRAGSAPVLYYADGSGDPGSPDELEITHAEITLLGKTLDISNMVDDEEIYEELCEYAHESV